MWQIRMAVFTRKYMQYKTHCPRQNALLSYIQLCLRPPIGLRGKYYYAPFDVLHYFASNVGFTNIVVRSTGQFGVETKYRVPTVQGQ